MCYKREYFLVWLKCGVIPSVLWSPVFVPSGGFGWFGNSPSPNFDVSSLGLDPRIPANENCVTLVNRKIAWQLDNLISFGWPMSRNFREPVYENPAMLGPNRDLKKFQWDDTMLLLNYVFFSRNFVLLSGLMTFTRNFTIPSRVSWKQRPPRPPNTPSEWLWTLLIRVRKLSESGSI